MKESKEISEQSSYNPSRPKPNSQLWLVIIIVIVLCGLSFFGGAVYEKGHVKSSAASLSSNAGGGYSRAGGGFSGRNGGQRPNIGDVTAVSSSSITIQNNFSGSSETFSITSSTTYTNAGQTGASVSDIQTGDRVLIRTSSSSSTQATEIDINPSFGGGGAGGSSGSSSTDSSGSSSTLSN
jgi:hypothetical protein